jgi:hypothetical protein
MNQTFAEVILAGHLVFILWVMFGALVTPGRRWLTALHLASLVYGISYGAGALALSAPAGRKFLRGARGDRAISKVIPAALSRRNHIFESLLCAANRGWSRCVRHEPLALCTTVCARKEEVLRPFT